MRNLVLLRHGLSQWSREKRFTGWGDVPLREQGGGARGGQGVARRRVRVRLRPIPVTHTWRVNERMYGALQGLNEAETVEKHGDEQVLVANQTKAK